MLRRVISWLRYPELYFCYLQSFFPKQAFKNMLRVSAIKILGKKELGLNNHTHRGKTTSFLNYWFSYIWRTSPVVAANLWCSSSFEAFSKKVIQSKMSKECHFSPIGCIEIFVLLQLAGKKFSSENFVECIDWNFNFFLIGLMHSKTGWWGF